MFSNGYRTEQSTALKRLSKEELEPYETYAEAAKRVARLERLNWKSSSAASAVRQLADAPLQPCFQRLAPAPRICDSTASSSSEGGEVLLVIVVSGKLLQGNTNQQHNI